MIPLLIASLVVTAAPEWRDADPQKLIAEGGAGPVLVYVHASWCGPCHQLEAEVIHKDAGRALLKRARGAIVDFDQSVGRQVTEKWRVLGLPTLLVLDATGTELGRVEGYTAADDWLGKVEKVLAGEQSLERLQARVSEAPGDMDARLDLARAQLARGQAEVAKKALEAIIAKGGTPGARAARVWGRYLVRVKKDGAAGAAHFAAMEKTFADSKFRPEFLYWHAHALQLQGQSKAAIALFDEWAVRDPRGEAPLLFKAEFMVHHRYEPKAIEPVLITIMSLDDEIADAHYLMAEVKLRMGDRAASMREIKRAMKLERGRVLYRNFARRRLGMTL